MASVILPFFLTMLSKLKNLWHNKIRIESRNESTETSEVEKGVKIQ